MHRTSQRLLGRSFVSLWLVCGILDAAFGPLEVPTGSPVAAQEAPPRFPGFPPAGFPPGKAVPGWDPAAFLDSFFPANPEDDRRLQTIEVSWKEEQEYGQRVLQTFLDDFQRRKIRVVSRGREVDYLRKLVAQLQPQMEHAERYRTVRILIAETDTTDAYSIPGGTLIIFQGMIEWAETEAALAAVLGHELSHLDRGHQLLPIKRMKLAQQERQAIGHDPAAMFRQARTFMTAFLKPFRPADELEADRDGVTWAYRAGYDPHGLLHLFGRLQERDPGGAFLPSFLRSHPYHADRLVAARERFAELQATEPRDDLGLGRTNLERRIPRSERRFDD